LATNQLDSRSEACLSKGLGYHTQSNKDRPLEIYSSTGLAKYYSCCFSVVIALQLSLDPPVKAPSLRHLNEKVPSELG
jgi:hypothetical protein